MPKRNPIPFLTPPVKTPGATYHWKPSARLRKLGWNNLKLGTDWDRAVAAALDRNEAAKDARAAPDGGAETAVNRRVAALERELARLQRRIADVVAASARTAPSKKRRCFVYFIGADDGPIKIGLSFNPKKRLAALQTHQAQKLRLIAVIEGGRLREQAYHKHFAAGRLTGEWFTRSDELMATIRSIIYSPRNARRHLPKSRRANSGARRSSHVRRSGDDWTPVRR